MTAGDVSQDQATVCVGEVNNNATCKPAATQLEASPAAGLKYSLRARSVKKRIEAERRQAEPKARQPRPKARPPPLSKYRRKTANARERDRMKDINQAFELLEGSLPDLTARQQAEKVTKITVLRLAIDYIKAMRALLAAECGDGAAGSPTSVLSTGSAGSASLSDYCSVDAEPPDPLDAIEGLTDFQLPGGLDLLMDIKIDSEGMDFGCDDFGDLPVASL